MSGAAGQPIMKTSKTRIKYTKLILGQSNSQYSLSNVLILKNKNLLVSDFIISNVCLIYFRKCSQESTVAQMARCHNTGPRVSGSNPTGGLPLRIGARDLDLSGALSVGLVSTNSRSRDLGLGYLGTRVTC